MQPVSKTHLSHLATAPLSLLLRRLGVAVSAHEANGILVEQGYLLNLQRPSLKHPGQTRSMRVLTRKGLLFGKNCGSPVHPLHSSPQFYAELFEILWAQVQRDVAATSKRVQPKAA